MRPPSRWTRSPTRLSYPIILVWQLGPSDAPTYRAHILPIADHIIFAVPGTRQERWEEAGGYSPSTIAAEIAAETRTVTHIF